MRFSLISILPLLFAPFVAQAAGRSAEVCNLRPDLCDHSTKTTKVIRVAPRPVAQRSRLCRIAGQPYSLDAVDLPICPAKIVQAPATKPQSLPTPSPAAMVSRKPAAASTLPIDFDTYMNSNSSHPAMVHHNAAQKAFQEAPKPVSFGLPADGVNSKDPESTAPVVAPTTGTNESAPASNMVPSH